MCNLLIVVFRGKFAEAVDLGEKEKLEIPGGWGGVQRPSGTEIPGGGVGGSKVKNLPWGVGMDIFWNHTMDEGKFCLHDLESVIKIFHYIG